jgi:hypothetical protein
MTDIVDKPIAVGRLPPELRDGLDPATLVLVTVRRITANGLTEAEEAAILAAEASDAATPFRPAREVLDELRAIADEA